MVRYVERHLPWLSFSRAIKIERLAIPIRKTTTVQGPSGLSEDFTNCIGMLVPCHPKTAYLPSDEDHFHDPSSH